MTDTVDELAKQGKKHRSSKMPAIPIGLVISCLIAMALIAVCAPMGTILANNSKDVVSDLSDIVMRDTVSSVVKGVTTLLATANSFTTAVARSLIVKNVMTTNFTDLEHQPEIVNLFFNMLETNQDFTNLMVLTYSNFSGQVDPDWWTTHSYFNFTAIMVSAAANSIRPFKDYTVLYVDYRSPKTMRWHTDFDNPGYVRPISPSFPSNIPYVWENVSTLSRQPAYLHMMSANPSNVTQINCTVYNGVPSLLASLNVWIPGRSEPAFMTGAASFLYNLENILIAAKPTPNSVIFVYEVALQRLVAASGANATVNMTAVTSKVGNPRYTPVDTIHAPTAGVGKALVDLYGGLDKVPRNNGTVVMASPDINGEPWFVNTVYLAVPPHDWQLVIAMPRKDFFSKIDKAQKTSIIVAVVVAVSGAFTVSLAAFASLRPLHQLAVSMKQLTKFDFSSLEGGVLDNRSLIREIRHVQETFSAMVNAFSVSIKKNRSLMAGGTMSGSAGGAAASGTRNPASSSG